MGILGFDDSRDSNKIRLMFGVITLLGCLVVIGMGLLTDVAEQRVPLLLFGSIMFVVAAWSSWVAYRKITK